MKKIITKSIALFLSLMMIVSLVPMNVFATGEVTVTSIEVVEQKFPLIENYGGNCITEKWVPGTDTYEPCEPYYVYNFGLGYVVLEITYSDGTVKYCTDGMGIVDDAFTDEYVTYSDNQGVDGKAWTVGGNNTASFEYMGVSCTYDVQIIENPVSAVSVTPNKTQYFENTGGFLCISDGMTAEEQPYEYYHYSLDYSATVTLKTGEVITEEEFADRFGYYFGVTHTQGPTTPWTVGNTYDVTIDALGVATSYSVSILENPVASIRVIEGKPIYENTDGRYTDQAISTDPTAGGYVTVDEYFYYNYDPARVNLEVTYTDGTVRTSNFGYEMYDGTGEPISWSASQDYVGENWTIGGTNEITFYYMGKECTYNVEILENPADSITGISVTSEKPIELLENIDGYYVDNEVDGVDCGFFFYQADLYSEDLTYTVTFKDGSEITGTMYEVNEELANTYFNGDWMAASNANMQIKSSYSQTYAEQWGVGPGHIIHIYIGDVDYDLEVMVVENPIERIEVEIKDTIMEDVDAYEVRDYIENEDGSITSSGPYWGYDFDLLAVDYEVTAIYKDETKAAETFTKEEWSKKFPTTWMEFETNQTIDTPLVIGENDVYVRFGNYTCQTTVELVECPYTDIAISGNEVLTLTLTKTDGTKETQTITYFDPYGTGSSWDGYGCDCRMYTDKDNYNCVVSWENDEDATNYHSLKNISIRLGKFESNTISVSKMVIANYVAYDQFAAIDAWVYADMEFPEFSGELTEENAEYIIGMAYSVSASGDTWDYEMSKDYIYDEENDVYYLEKTVDEVKERLTKVFDIDVSTFDFTALDSYSDGIIKVEDAPFAGDGWDAYVLNPAPTCVYDAESQCWTVTELLYDDEEHTVVVNSDLKVVSIDAPKEQPETGLTVAQASDGNWYSYKNGEKVNYTGFAENDLGVWYVTNGKVTFKDNGVIYDANDATWKYVENSKWVITDTIAKNNLGWWRVEEGIVNFEATGIYQNSNGWFYCKDGKVDFSYNGFAEKEGETYYVVNGKLTNNVNGIYRDSRDGQWKYVEKSKFTKATTIASNELGWWRVEDGIVNFKATGIYQNANGWFYCYNGQVNFNYNGFAEKEGETYYVVNGKLTNNVNGVYKDARDGQWKYVEKSKFTKATTIASNELGWWRVEDGIVNFKATGIYQNSNGWFYCKDGKVDFSYNGFAEKGEDTYYVVNGKLTNNVNGVYKDSRDGQWKYVENSKWTITDTIAKNDLGWWRIEGGVVNFKATGIYQNVNGWFYCYNGQVNFSYNGFAEKEGETYYVVNGKLTNNVNGIYKDTRDGKWKYVKNSKFTEETIVANNSNGWFYCKDGVVDFTFTGIGSNANGDWYCVNGKVDFSKNGTVTYDGTTYTIKGGKVV